MDNIESFDSKAIREAVEKVLFSIMFDQYADYEKYEKMIENAIISAGYEVISVSIDQSPEVVDKNELRGRAIILIRGIERSFDFCLSPTGIKQQFNEED